MTECEFEPMPRPVDLGVFVAFFYIYVDESGKLSGKSDYTSLCGFVGHSQEWHRFAMEWNSTRFKWQVPPLHMGQIMSPSPRDAKWKAKREEWGDLWENKRDAMLSEFGQIIRTAGIICVGSVVDANAYREIRQKIAGGDADLILHFDDSNVFGFHNIIMRSLEKIEVVDKHNPVGIIVDDDAQTVKGYYDLLENLRTHTQEGFAKVRERVHGISFCKDESYPGLQAADMMAFEARKFMVSKMSDESAEPSELYLAITHFGMNQPQLYTSAMLYKIASGTAAAMKAANDGQTES